MDFSMVTLDAAQQAFTDEVRSVIAEVVTDEVHAHEREHGHSFDENVHRTLGARGWIMPAWPVERGGAGLDPIRRRILELEMVKADAPFVSAGTTALVSVAVERFARPDLAAELMPKVASGQVRFCLGYTEPDGGSDIAAAKTRAVRDGEEWVINGSKIFTTGAQNCQYTFLITRTAPEKPKHQGLTMFLVPLDTPGVQIQGIRAFSGERTNVVYYGDVRISDRYRLGEVDGGWTVLKGPLDEEHSIGRESAGLNESSVAWQFLRVLEKTLDAVVDWALTSTSPDGTHPADDPAVRRRLGEVFVELQAAQSTTGPMGRVAGSEALVRCSAALIDLVGPAGVLPHGADGAIGGGALDDAHRYAQGTATYGGTVEVFRTIIAQHVLGLPRPSYPGAKMIVSRRQPAAASLAS